MIEKQLNYGNDAKSLLLSGVNKMADAVKTTLGAAGNTVIIEDEFGRPHVTKDGVSVAKSILLSDPVENMGAKVLLQASMKTADLAGDGTTTSVVIAQAMLKKAFSGLDGLNVTEVRNHLQKMSEDAIDRLTSRSKKVTPESLSDVASISANNDKELGSIIADAYNKVGVDGAVSIEESMTSQTYTEIVNGTRMKKGYSSPYLITDKEKNVATLENPIVFVSDKKIDTREDIEPVLEVAVKNKRSILIIADVDPTVMAFLIHNKAKGLLRVNVVNPEGVGLNRFELLEDLSIMTGATLISDETGHDFTGIDADFLGFAEKSVSNDRETIITLNSDRTADAVKERSAMVRKTIEDRKDDANKWHYKDRLSRLAGGIAAIHVGASTEVEMKEKKDRVEDAIFATRAALEEGIVAGGGIALKKVAIMYPKRLKVSAEEVFAREILVAGLSEPIERILFNADCSIEEFNEKMNSMSWRSNYGFDVKRKKYGDMFEMGIIDPLKVSKNAIRNSTSVVLTLLTTSCVVSNKRA